MIVLRGHGVTPWELRPWELLTERYDVTVLVTDRNRFESSTLELPTRRVRSRRGFLPRGRIGDVAVLSIGDRYVGLADHLRQADIVHALELGVPWSGQPAMMKSQFGYRLVLTVWETIPLLDSYRFRRGRTYRRAAIDACDLFLATTGRARDALLLEGVSPDKIEVAPPGIAIDRFGHEARLPEAVVSVGRLVWEKGHQDVLRAVAALRHGLVSGDPPNLRIVGSGPESGRLRRYADELGIADLVSFAAVPYEEMPALLARASALVLASLPTQVWEEQFGMVLAEALATGVPIIAADSGAIPEVVGPDGVLVRTGDWIQLAQTLASVPAEPAPRERAKRYSLEAAAERLASAYERVLGE